jgi:hypothetical protein
MRKIAKPLVNRRRQAVIPTRKRESWDDLFALADATEIPDDFPRRHDRCPQRRRRP